MKEPPEWRAPEETLAWALLVFRAKPARATAQQAGGNEGLQEARCSQNTQNFLHGSTPDRFEDDLCSVIFGGGEREVVLVSR